MPVRFTPCVWALCFACCAAPSTVHAQDVTVSPLAWLDAAGTADELPVQKGLKTPKFPEELRKTTQPGWAEIDTYIDDKGVIYQQEIHASLPYYRDAVGRALNWSKTTYAPAKRGGIPVAARVRQTILFNPAGAAATGSEAKPRMLAAAIVVDPARASASEVTRLPETVVWANFSIDATGAVTEVGGVSERLTGLIRENLGRWRFAAARQNGAPVATVMRVPVILDAPGGLHLSDTVPARLLTRTPVGYPRAEMLSHVDAGFAEAEFTVDTNGRTRDVRVRRMSSRGFGYVLREAIASWTYQPARRAGQPVATRHRQTVWFSMTEGEPDDEAGLGAVYTNMGDVSKLPEHLRYDVSPRVDQLVQAKYPYALLRDKVGGSAQVVVVIDPQGQVAATRVMRADRPEFGYALQAAIEQIVYQPALRKGDPTAAMITVTEKFEPDPERTLMLTPGEKQALELETKQPERIVPAAELDSPPAPIEARLPRYPVSLAAPVPGRATIEGLIDENGNFLLPRVVSASDPVFGYAAAQAAADWLFAPPRRGGKLVLTRVQVPVEFKAPAGATEMAPRPKTNS